MCLGRTGRGPITAEVVSAAAAGDVAVQFRSADLGSADDVAHALLAATHSGELRSVLHAGGALADALVPRQTLQGARAAFAPKAGGGALLAAAAAVRAPSARLQLFSSMSGALGNGGQANYAAANAALDALALQLQASAAAGPTAILPRHCCCITAAHPAQTSSTASTAVLQKSCSVVLIVTSTQCASPCGISAVLVFHESHLRCRHQLFVSTSTEAYALMQDICNLSMRALFSSARCPMTVRARSRVRILLEPQPLDWICRWLSSKGGAGSAGVGAPGHQHCLGPVGRQWDGGR